MCKIIKIYLFKTIMSAEVPYLLFCQDWILLKTYAYNTVLNIEYWHLTIDVKGPIFLTNTFEFGAILQNRSTSSKKYFKKSNSYQLFNIYQWKTIKRVSKISRKNQLEIPTKIPNFNFRLNSPLSIFQKRKEFPLVSGS